MNIVFCHSIILTFTTYRMLTHCDTGWLHCRELVILQEPVPLRTCTTSVHGETGLTFL